MSDVSILLSRTPVEDRPRRAVPVAAALLTSACGAPPPKPVQKEVVIWKNLGEWSGRGNAQTESFIGLTGSLRMHWRTKNEAPKRVGDVPADPRERHQRTCPPGARGRKGLWRGHRLRGRGSARYYITVESANLDWSFTVEEALFGSPAENPRAPH